MKTERRKRHLYRRLTTIASWITGISLGSVFVILGAILIAAAIFVRTETFQTGLRDRVLQIARQELDAVITFEKARVEVFSFEPRIHFEGVQFVDDDQKISATVNRISAGISVFSLPLLAFQQLVLSSAEIEGLTYPIENTKIFDRWLKALRPRKGIIPSQFQTSIQKVLLTDVHFPLKLSERDIFKNKVSGSINIESVQVGLTSDQIEVSGLIALKEITVDDIGPYDTELSLDRAIQKGERIQFRKLQLKRGDDVVSLSGSVQDYSKPTLDVKGNASVDLGFYFKKSQFVGQLTSELALKGPWNALKGEGSAVVKNARWHLKKMEEVQARWSLSDNTFDLKNLIWRDGEETGKGRAVIPFTEGKSSQIDVEAESIDLRSYLGLAHEDLRNWQGKASGRLQFDGIISSQFSGKAEWDLKIQGFEIRSFTDSVLIVKVPEMQLKGIADFQPGFIGNGRVTLQTPTSSWTSHAQWTADRFKWTWDSKFAGGYFGDLFGYKLNLTGALPGSLDGPWSDLVLLAQPNFQTFRMNGQDLTNFRGTLKLEDRRLTGNPLIADQLSIQGGIYIADRGEDKFHDLKFGIRNIDVQEFLGFLGVGAQDVYDFNGRLFGSGYLAGDLLRPNGSGSLKVNDWSVGKTGAKGISAKAQWAAAKGEFYFDDVEVYTSKGQAPVTGSMTVDGQGILDASLGGKRLRLSDWTVLWGQDFNIQSLADLDFEYQRDVPSLSLKANLIETSMAGIVQKDSEIELQWMRGILRGKAKLFGGDFDINFRGQGEGRERSTEVDWNLSKVNLSPWIPFFANSRLETIVSGAGNLKIQGPLDKPHSVVGEFSAKDALIQRTQLVLQRTKPFRVLLTKGEKAAYRFSLPDLNIFSEGRELQVSGFYESAENFRIKLNGSTDLRVAAGFSPIFSRAEGVLNASGELNPRGFTGRGDLSDGLLTFQGSSIVVKEVEAVIRAENSHFEVSRLNGNFREGTMSASGNFVLTPTGIPDAKMNVKLDQIFLQPDDGISFRSSGFLDLKVVSNKGDISGKIFISDGLFRQRIDLRSDLMKFFESDRRIFRPKDSDLMEWRQWKLNVQLATSEPFNLRNNVGEGAANLSLGLIGTVGDPRVTGNVELVRGQFSFNGRQFNMRSGAIRFQNPNSNVPNYDIRADTEVSDYTVFMRLEGGPGKQKITYSSEPPLSEKDILSLISFGIPASADELKGQDQGRSVSFSGLSFVTGALQDKIEGRLSRDLGIQRFQLGPAFFEETGRTELQFTVGTDLIRNKLGINYSNFLSAPGGHKVELDFKVNRNVSLIGSWRDVTEQQGEGAESADDFGGDIRVRFEFE